jgi:hypothetical protein
MIINRYCGRVVRGLTLILGLVRPPIASAQSLNLAALEGDWVRIGSNYDPNDQMRIKIAGGAATIVRVPAGAPASFRPGGTLWAGIQVDGTVRVFGSDGNYYPGSLEMRDGELTLSVDKTARGNDQHWRRAGPSIDGDWERVAPSDTPENGTQVRAEGTLGSIRFLPVSAPRRYRVGTRLWRNVGTGGAMEVMGTDGQYHPVQVTLIGNDSLRIDNPSAGFGGGQLWVRPGAAAAARTSLPTPPANLNMPDTTPPSGLPGITPDPATPTPGRA